MPVHEGYVLRKCIQRSPMAGLRVTEDLLRYLSSAVSGGASDAGDAPVVHPRYECDRVVRFVRFVLRLLRRASLTCTTQADSEGVVRVAIRSFPRTHPTYRAHMVRDVVRDLKESTCCVSDVDYSDTVYDKVPSVSYQLPDGRVVQLGAQRFKSPELLFKPDLYNPMVGGGMVDEKVRGVHELVYGAIQLAEPDLRRELWGSIVLAGGTTMMQGFRVSAAACARPRVLNAALVL